MAKAYIYCEMLLENVRATYHYISDFEVKAGDIVIVPFGYENNERAALIVDVNVCTASDAPYPPSKTKHILRVFGDSENENLTEEKNLLERKKSKYIKPEGLTEKLKIKQQLVQNKVENNKIAKSRKKIAKMAAAAQQIIKKGSSATIKTNSGIFELSDDGKTVVDFKKPAGKDLLEIIIPDGVETIEDNVFLRVNINKMYIPKTLKNIGRYTFHTPTPAPVWEYSLKNIDFVEVEEGNSYYSADETAFYSLHDGKKRLEFLFDKSIEEYAAPDDVVSFSDYAFHGCKQLKKVTLSPLAEDFTEYCLYNISQVKEIYIPARVKHILPKMWDGNYANWSVVSYKIDENNKNFFMTDDAIYENLDDGSYRLIACIDESKRKITVLDNTTEIGEEAFQGRKKITTVILPSSLKKIGHAAFEYSGLKKIDIPEGVEHIEDYAFGSCDLTNIRFPSTLKYIGENALERSWGLKKVQFAAKDSPYVYKDYTIKKKFDSKKKKLSGDNPYEYAEKLFDEYADIILSAVRENSLSSGHSRDSVSYDPEKHVITVVTKLYQQEDSQPLTKERVQCAENMHPDDRLIVDTTKYYWEFFAEDGKSLGYISNIFSEQTKRYHNFVEVVNAAVETITPKSKRAANARCATGSVRFDIRKRKLPENLTSKDMKVMLKFDYILKEDEAVITAIKEDYNSGVLTVPNSIEGKPVLSLTSAVLDSVYFHSFNKLVILEGVRRIEDKALFELRGIKKVILPETIEYISPKVFAYPDGRFKDLDLREDIIFVAPKDSYADKFLKGYKVKNREENFLIVKNEDADISENDTLLRKLTLSKSKDGIVVSLISLPKSIKEVRVPAYINDFPVIAVDVGYCDLDTVYIPETTVNIKRLYSCNAKNIIIDENNTVYYSDGKGIYNRSQKTLCKLTAVDAKEYTVADGTEIIEEKAFANAVNLERLVLPDSLKCIKEKAFMGCRKLCSITGLEHVEEADESIFAASEYFYNNYRSEYPYIVNTDVVIVGKNVFKYNALSEKVVRLPDGITTICEYAFAWDNSNDCVEEIILPESVKVIKNAAFSGRKQLKNINIPEGVKQLPSDMLAGCSSLEKIYIPAYVEKIDISAFPGGECGGAFKTIEVNEKNRNYSSNDGMLFNIEKNELLYVPAANNTDTMIIPEGVRRLGCYMMRGNKNIKKVVLSENVEEIGEGAFEDCSALKTVVLSDSVRVIERKAFGTTALTEITIPENVRKIGYQAFENTDIKQVVLPLSATDVHHLAFPYNTEIDESNIESVHGKYYREMYRDAQRIFVVFRGSHAEIEQLENYLTTNKLQYDVETISDSISQLRLYDTDDTLTILKEFPHLTATGLSEEYWDVGIWFSDAGYGYYTDYVKGPDIDGHDEGGAGRWTWEISDITQSYRGWYRHSSSGEKDYVNYCYPFMDKWNRAGGIETESDSTDAEPAGERLYIKVKFENGKAYRYFCNYKVNIGDTVFVQGKLAGQEGTVAEIIDSQPTGQAEAYTLYVTSVKKKDE